MPLLNLHLYTMTGATKSNSPQGIIPLPKNWKRKKNLLILYWWRKNITQLINCIFFFLGFLFLKLSLKILFSSHLMSLKRMSPVLWMQNKNSFLIFIQTKQKHFDFGPSCSIFAKNLLFLGKHCLKKTKQKQSCSKSVIYAIVRFDFYLALLVAVNLTPRPSQLIDIDTNKNGLDLIGNILLRIFEIWDMDYKSSFKKFAFSIKKF